VGGQALHALQHGYHLVGGKGIQGGSGWVSMGHWTTVAGLMYKKL
jgi:hypothetical protein